MGLKDQQDGTGHILGLELGLEYLHVDGTDRTAGMANAGSVEEVGVGAQSTGSSITTSNSNFSSSSNFSEENSDSEDEPARPSSTCLEPNEGAPESPKPSPGTDAMADCRSKVDFALKLGYPEELVLLVIRKLGPGALINDVLGELVKLGTKSEPPPQGGGSTATAPSTLPLTLLDSCRPLCSNQWPEDKENLRPVVVDGSNVAMSHGNKEVFSCQGIQLAVDWFLDRGHRDITVFVPAWRKEQSRPDALISEQEILRRLEKQKILVFTPSRRVQGRRVVCYDDRFIVKLAYESDGIIVSNDNYRDLANEKPEWKKFIDERLLMYSFVNDKFMPPDDPLGRHGPSLENFLRKRPTIPEHRRQPCPYGKKCTYGHKCKFYHPERGSQPQRAVADELRASVKISSVSRGLMEDALTVTSQSLFEVEGTEPEHWQSTPKKQSNPSLRGSLTDLYEDKRKVQSRRGSSSSSSSGCSSFLGYPALGGPPSPGSIDRWDCMGSSTSSSGAIKALGEHRCESPEVGYSSLVKAYSGLRLEVPESPDDFSTIQDLKSKSLLSDCSSEGSSNIFSPDVIVDSGPRFHHLHRRYPGHSMYSASRHGLKQHSPQLFSQDMPKQRCLETNFTFEESTSFQTGSVEHNQHSPQGRSQDLAKHEYGSSFRDPPSSHRSFLSIAKGPEHGTQGYHTGLQKHCFPLSNSFEEIPSTMNSQTNRICHINSPESNRQSPQIPYYGLPKQNGCQTSFSFEESTSSSMSFSGFPGLNPHSPQTYPLGLSRQQGFGCSEDSSPSLDCHASHILHASHPELNEQIPGYPPGVPKLHDFNTDYSFTNPPSSVTTHSPQHAFMPRSNAKTSPKGFSGDFHSLPPQTPYMSSIHSHQLHSHKGNNMMHSPWKKGGNQDDKMYDPTLPNTRSSSNQQPQINWNIHGQQSYKPYNLFDKNLQDVSEKTWNSPWGRLSSFQGPSKQSTSDTPSGLRLHQEPPAFNQYQDLREKLFINLCGIFPPDLVRLVMARNPHTMDAQELAAAILLAKSQCSI